MKRLNLDAFKAQVNETQELENLTGGILGACHCTDDYELPPDPTVVEIFMFWWNS